ncbi:MAG: hypothetical protein RL154_610 [Pseudomonadota bacterium]|jgi:hypothetical protein
MRYNSVKKNGLSMNKDTFSLQTNRDFWLAVILVYAWGILARMFWVYWASGFPEFFWNAQLMVNTNDSYYFAEGARDILSGTHQLGDRSPVDEALPIISAWLTKFSPFSLESIILFMPAIFSSFVVIPLALVGKELNRPLLGLTAGVLAVITHSFYNRTMVGYYATDLFGLVTPSFVAFFAYAVLKNASTTRIIGLLTSVAFAMWTYRSSYSLVLATLIVMGGYALIYNRQNKKIWYTLALSLVALVEFEPLLKTAILFIGMALLIKQEEKALKLLPIVALLGVVVFWYFGGLDPIINRLDAYVFGKSLQVQEASLKYFDVVQTIREAGKIDINTLATRISGSLFVFILSIAGLGWLIFKERQLIVFLPMLGLGLLAYKAGLRFTAFGVPAAALGFAALIYYASDYIKERTGKIAFIAVGIMLALAPNIAHILEYKVPVVLEASEVKLLNDFGKSVTPEDYVYAWWDYGYPIRYYADVKNHSDGGKHDGATNFIESTILTASSQALAANMLREATEKHEELIAQNNVNKIGVFELILKERNVTDPNILLEQMGQKSFTTSKKTRDAYVYMPLEMLEIFPTVKLFSNIDLKTGHSKSEPFFMSAPIIGNTNDALQLANGIVINKSDGTVLAGSSKLTLESMDIVRDGIVKHEEFGNGRVRLIILADSQTAILADDETYNSAYIQMFALNNYDKSLFEPVVETPKLKIFKLKI